MYVCVHVCTYVRMYVCMYVFINVFIYLCIYVFMCICIYEATVAAVGVVASLPAVQCDSPELFAMLL